MKYTNRILGIVYYFMGIAGFFVSVPKEGLEVLWVIGWTGLASMGIYKFVIN